MSDQEQEKGPENNNANDHSRHGDCDIKNPRHAQAGVEVVDLAQLIKATVVGVMAEMAQPQTPGSEPKPSTSQAPDKEGRKRDHTHVMSDSEGHRSPPAKVARKQNQETQPPVEEADDIEDYLGRSDSEPEEEIQDDNGDNMLADLAQEFAPDDEVGEEVPKELVNMVVKMHKFRANDDQLKELLAKQLRPSNIPDIVSPRVNAAIWAKLKGSVKTVDLKMYKVCEIMMKQYIRNILLINKLDKFREKTKDRTVRSEIKSITREAILVTKVGAASIHSMNNARRTLIRENLNETYRGLCNPPEEEGKELFGENLGDKIKEMSDASRIARQIVDSPRYKDRNNNYKKGQPEYHKRRYIASQNSDKPQSEKLETDLIAKSVSRQKLPPRPREAGREQPSPLQKGRERLEAQGQQEELTLVGTISLVWENFKIRTIANAEWNAEHFHAGKLRDHAGYWKTLTSDPHIISMIKGTEIELEHDVVQTVVPKPYDFPNDKKHKINNEIKKLLKKGVIIKCQRIVKGHVSNIFTRDKTDGSLRIILNLSDFNENVVYRHFKMDNLITAINLMSKNCLMASIDWKDAFYSVPIAKHHQKYLQFEWEGLRYNYTCMPNGLSSAPRNFTKLTKVIFAELRKQGFMSTNYIDDCLLLGRSVTECMKNVRATVEMSEKAGFVIHPEKSRLEPATNITYLGFILDSSDMTVKPTAKKAAKIEKAVNELLDKPRMSIRQLSQVVGMLVSIFPGAKYAKLFYRLCDNYKNKALKENRGNYCATITLPDSCREDLHWWSKNVTLVNCPINKGKPRFTLETDASNTGWGGCIKDEHEMRSTGGNWGAEEAKMHINYLELLAAWLIIQSFCKDTKKSHIKVLSDNTTTVAYLNNMGGTKEKCNELARKIWYWYYKNNNWISSAHLPGKDNIIADKESRSIHDNTEWKLNPILFTCICQRWGTPTIDLFASRLNHQVEKYVSWKADPGVVAVDTMSTDWSSDFFYAFPPFNMIGRVLRKIEEEGAEGIIVVPHWPTQSWFAKLMNMCHKKPCILYRKDAAPTLSHPWRKEETLPSTRMLAAPVSGQHLSRQESTTSQDHYCWHLGDKELINSMEFI